MSTTCQVLLYDLQRFDSQDIWDVAYPLFKGQENEVGWPSLL